MADFKNYPSLFPPASLFLIIVDSFAAVIFGDAIESNARAQLRDLIARPPPPHAAAAAAASSETLVSEFLSPSQISSRLLPLASRGVDSMESDAVASGFTNMVGFLAPFSSIRSEFECCSSLSWRRMRRRFVCLRIPWSSTGYPCSGTRRLRAPPLVSCPQVSVWIYLCADSEFLLIDLLECWFLFYVSDHCKIVHLSGRPFYVVKITKFSILHSGYDPRSPKFLPFCRMFLEFLWCRNASLVDQLLIKFL